MELGTYFQFILALIFVLALISLLAWAYRYFALGHKMLGHPHKEKRLEIIEMKHVDAKRKLALIRRDNTEHLVLLGPNSELLIEAGIDVQAAKKPDLETVARDQ